MKRSQFIKGIIFIALLILFSSCDRCLYEGTSIIEFPTYTSYHYRPILVQPHPHMMAKPAYRPTTRINYPVPNHRNPSNNCPSNNHPRQFNKR